ncbi:hypothetical protein [Microbacterium sp. ABRD28]|uniref:hypothetical protein n=1 Tax=Microbacterium sp. ABRD28 TaxID=2268461 RepID=UPI000F5587A3|nr:hypothetical protein [Microbacterium sp. ABRD28]
MMVAGGIAALAPLTVLAISSRFFSLGEQAFIATAAATGAFLAAVVGAMLLESRLATPGLNQRTYIPLWSTCVGIVGASAVAVAPTSFIAISIGLPAVMIALQVGRTHAVSSSTWRTEIIAAAGLLAGISLAVIMTGLGNPRALAPLGVGAAAAVLARAIGAPVRVSGRTPRSTAVWVTAETAVVAAVPYGTTFIVLSQLGDADTVAFRLVLSTLGVLQPVLGYLRTRLLNEHSTALVVSTWVLSASALLVVIGADSTGVLTLLYGQAWEAVTAPALLAACFWKLLTIPETVPFASLRRRGSVKIVFSARSASSLINLAMALLASATYGSLTAVFLAFAIAQAATVVLYVLLNRRESGQDDRWPL